MKTTLLALVTCVAVSAPALAQSQADRPAAPNASPTIELTVGANGPQYRTAQSPGATLSITGLKALSPTAGVGFVFEADGSYVRTGRAAGVRFYRRNGSLATGKHSTYFVQVLGGYSEGGVSGIISSTGGRTVQPGVGLAYGDAHGAWHLELDYRHVADGRITRGKSGESESMSGYRVLIGFTWRWRQR